MEAFKLFNSHQHDIELALLDVVMPHCGGMELAIKIREKAADLPIIFLTGYDKEHVLNDNSALQNSCILSKPIQFEVLNCIINDQLAKTGDL